VRLSDLPQPSTPAATRAAGAVAAYSSPALVNHCHRSYLWSAALGVSQGLAFDVELLYVAAMLHDLGLVGAFDNATLPFEEAGGHVGWMFAAGAGWPVERRERVAEVVVRHMWDAVDPATDPEGYLLEAGTGLDISGRDARRWAAELRSEVLGAYPRLDLAAEFLACFEEQARRKPASTAAAAVRSGIGERLRANPLEDDEQT
jgi:HD domain-containing protein